MYRNITRAFIVAAALGFGLCSTATADMAVIFNSNATLQGTIDVGQPGPQSGVVSLDIDETEFSNIEVLLQEVGGPLLGSASISNLNGDGMNFDLNLHLDMVRSGSGAWTGIGTFALTDIDTQTPAFFGNIVTNSVGMKGGTTLEIEASMSGNSPILVNRPNGGPDWTYQGENSAVTVTGADAFDSGYIFALQFNTGRSSLDDLFGTSASYSGGKIEGTVVPEPAAALLGLMGFGMVGWARRRFA